MQFARESFFENLTKIKQFCSSKKTPDTWEPILYIVTFNFQILMDNKADINAIMRNSKGQLMTPLDAALYRGNRGCAKYIQLHGGILANKLMDKTALKKALTM
jgi:hypothetical protein